MLAEPGPEVGQSEDAAPDSDSDSHSHDHAGGPSHSYSQPHTYSQSHTHTHSHPQPHSHSHSQTQPQSQPQPQPHSQATTPTPTSSSSPRPKTSQGENDLAQDKVRSTLRSFVRDWSVEGAPERKACYDPCLEALERHFPAVTGTGGRDRGEVKVLVPGCGLGRLAMEIAARGE